MTVVTMYSTMHHPGIETRFQDFLEMLIKYIADSLIESYLPYNATWDMIWDMIWDI